MSDVFVSYSRADDRFVRQLHEALERVGKDAWVDWQDIAPTAEWRAEIYQAIEDADAFVFVLSPESVSSEECARELAHAAGHNKIVPLHYRAVDPRVVPDPASSHQWISFESDGGFDRSFQELVRALDTDLEWVATHTHWLRRARDWEKQGRDKSLLLRGSDLRSAEEWLSRQGEKHKPDPTPLHNEYVYASRRATSRRQRGVVGAISGALVVAVTLAIFALIARNEAETQKLSSQANTLTARAELVRSRPRLSALLAEEAVHRAPDAASRVGAESMLRNRLASMEHRVLMSGHKGPVLGAAFSPNGTEVVTGGDDGTVRIWDARSGREVRRLRGHDGPVLSTAFSPDGRELVTGGDDGTVRIWDARSGREVRRLRGHDGPVSSTAFSPEGEQVVTAGDDLTARIWDVRSGREAVAMRGDEAYLSSAAFSPGGDQVGAGGADPVLSQGRDRKRCLQPRR